MAYNKHNADKCDQTPPVCDICRKRHLTALHVEATPGSKDKLNTATTETKVPLQLARKSAGRRKPAGRVLESS